jgi:hypothetical protein
MGLLCPQQIAQQTNKPGDGFNALGPHGILTFDGFTRTVPYDRGSRLPILFSIDGIQSYIANMSHAASPMPSTTDNHTAKQKLLLRWHNRLSHMNFQKLQDLARIGALPKSILGCDLPSCRSCQLGKAHRRASASNATKSPVDSDDLAPGDKVSIDQSESSTPGLVDTFKGKPTKARYTTA